ncbi:MAG TPA: acyl-CoA dehydrogenase family protein, partial [Acidimicrobiia bacterium]|nr:acyl-CoA dehydrogenase family protein [Acidimicrobiia bacterium]
MDFALSTRCQELQGKLTQFMEDHVYPAESVYEDQLRAAGDPHAHAPVIEDLKAQARHRGLWNLFLPHKTQWTEGLSNLDYAPLAEIMGRSPLGPEACNCSAPDTGNMEVLTMFGTPEQQEQWLHPLLEGEIRSAFAMTEPQVASSDATNISTSIERRGDEYVINGHKWFISGAYHPHCRVLIVMGKTDPAAAPHRQQSQVLVPMDTPGITIRRNMKVFGYDDAEGHVEMTFEDVRVPVSNLIGEEGGGFAIAQARLGPGRIHHCMRALGGAERALALMVHRANNRIAFGRPLADQGLVQQAIAQSRNEIDQARLL